MPTESESKNPYCQHLPNDLSFNLIQVKGGSYLLGNSDHEITLADFYIGQYPVTQALWQAVMGDTPAHFKGKNRPVESISWYDAAAFCNALNARTGYPPAYFRDKKFQEALNYGMTLPLEEAEDYINVFYNPQNSGYRLPSETEWEYAARGGSKRSSYEYVGSDKLEEVGWYYDNSHGETKPVGLKASNELDIYDMSGNIWEWCADQYTDLINLPQDGFAGMGDHEGVYQVLRGGGWDNDALDCLAIDSYEYDLSFRSHHFGLRVVLFPPPAPF
jgi:formylglycine-generating enzyme required for sulfatase activity